ncbi:MAG: hypothetical protein AB7V62_00920 [Thermoleophilia bacterium]
MPGGRWITGRDVLAAARTARGVAVDGAALAAAVRPGDLFPSYEALRAAAPPEALGLTPGAHAALFAPLFGEFE